MIAGAVTAGRGRAALAVMMASGFAGLGYQIVWTQQCALWLGHEAAAVLAVVTAFFGGLAVGAMVFGPIIERSRAPRRWYAGCELLIALWSLLLALSMAAFSDALLALIGPQPTPLWQWTLAFAGTFLLLLPATAAMGATLPAMARITAGGQDRRQIAALYAANTFGAAIGVLAILLGITMWLQFKLNPAPMDPVQEQMFAIMPWMMMFIMAPFAAGLLIYWITSNILTIAQQKYLYARHPQMKAMVDKERADVAAAKKAAK